jgi:hypothetical protein
MPQLPLQTDTHLVPSTNDECHGLALVARLEAQLGFTTSEPGDEPSEGERGDRALG